MLEVHAKVRSILAPGLRPVLLAISTVMVSIAQMPATASAEPGEASQFETAVGKMSFDRHGTRTWCVSRAEGAGIPPVAATKAYETDPGPAP